MMKRLVNLLLIAVFALELVSPLAFAQGVGNPGTGIGSAPVGASGVGGVAAGVPGTSVGGPATSPFNIPGSCQLNEMTQQEVQLFWEQTQRFRADEINALPDSEIMRNRPSQAQTINININTAGEKVFPFSTISRFLRLDEDKSKTAADSIGKAITDRVTEQEAKQLAKRFGSSESEMSDFLATLRGTVAEEGPAYDNYKVTLLNGAQIPNKALRNVIEQTQSCMINNAHIQGRVSYVASVGDDITLAFDGSASQLKKPNKLWSQETNADLDLQGAGTLVIPKHYEELVKKMKFWIMTDMIQTMGQMAAFFGGKRTVERYKGRLDEIEKRMIGLQQNPLVTQQLAADSLKKHVYALGSRRQISPDTFTTALDGVESELQHRLSGGAMSQLQFTEKKAVLDNIRGELAGVGSGKYADEIYDRYEGKLFDVTEFSDPEVTEIRKARIGQRYQSEYTKTLGELNGAEFQSDLDKIKRALQRRTGQFWVRVAFGMSWLGPGRFIFEITDAVNFRQISGKAFADNYVTVFANNNDVAGEFRRATNLMLSGSITDVISDWTNEGVPTAAYWVGNMLLFNMPVEETLPTGATGNSGASTSSVTSFISTGGEWNVTARWKGKSDAVIAEELTAKSEYSRLPLEVKGKSWGMKIRAKKEFNDFYRTMEFLAPLISWKILGAVDYSLTGARLLFYDYYIGDFVSPGKVKKDEACSMEKIDEYVSAYRALTIANIVVGWVPVVNYWKTGFIASLASAKTLAGKTGIKTLKFFDKYVETVVQVLDPITLAQAYYASEALQYASFCKDDQYTIVAFLSLNKRSPSTFAEKLKAVSTNDILSKLNVGKAALGLGEELDASLLSEYPNLKAELNDQSSNVKAQKLFRLGFKDASIEWLPTTDLPGQPTSCQRKCLDSSTQACCIDANKVECVDKKTGVATTIANGPRGFNHREFDSFAATVIPNKYITTSLAGCPGSFLSVDSGTNLRLSAGSGCGGGQCLLSQLQFITGRPITGDLTPTLGRVTRIYTSTGVVDFSNGIIRFTGPGPNGESELRSPGIDVLNAASASQESALKQGASVTVNGDGKVYLHGFISSNAPSEVEIGELRSLMTERGRINYLGSGQVQVFLHVLSQIDASLIRQVNTAPVQKEQCPAGLPGIKIINVEGQPGVGDAAAQEMNAALQKLQGDCGLQILETADKKFMITTDENGNSILRVYDKKTGEVTDYKINGPLRQEGNNIVIPTDKGDFKFNIGMNENGQPTLGVQGPNGLNELLPLLAARGLGGVLLYNPGTGQWGAFNGQDLAMNPNFATRGQTISADGEGRVRGQPLDDLLYPSPRRKATGGNALASLPSWPSETPAIALLILITLLGVATIRFKK